VNGDESCNSQETRVRGRGNVTIVEKFIAKRRKIMIGRKTKEMPIIIIESID
jgi:hypothetical protein